MPSRIWYQSFVHPTRQAPYIQRLQALLDKVGGPDVRFEVQGLEAPVQFFDALTEFRCAGQVIQNALAAEKAGYEAFLLGHFQEPGLLEIRTAVDIPVVSLGESNLLAALSMGHRFGLVTVDPIFIPWHDRQVRGHGFNERYVGTTSLKMDLPMFMKAFTEEEAYRAVRAEFAEQVKPLIARGAEVIIPSGGLPMLLFARESPFVIDGALVANGIVVAAKAAEMALALRAHTGAFVSRHGTYAKASEGSIREFLESR